MMYKVHDTTNDFPLMKQDVQVSESEVQNHERKVDFQFAPWK